MKNKVQHTVYPNILFKTNISTKNAFNIYILEAIKVV